MNIIRSLAVTGLTSMTLAAARAQFADTAVAYSPGTGANASYQNPAAALGAPATWIGYQNADPFNPPYLPTDIVGLGTGGSLTLQFNTPIQNTTQPYGVDFIIFGHSGFTEDFNTGTTDGTLFTGGTATVQVSVSADGVHFYTLNPALAPQVDALYPTDASGSPFVAVNPALTASDFAGQDLAGIRALYAGSAGGAGFDLAWAIDSNNQPVNLPSVSYIRLDDLSGVAYIDAVSVVPEPGAWEIAAVILAGWSLRRQAHRS